MYKPSIAALLLFATFACAILMPTSAPAAMLDSRAPSPQQSQSSASSPSGTGSSSAAKKKSSKKHHASKREPTQKAPTPERISEIQSALARGGYYQGTPNGKWDSNTVAAMQKFQSDNGLSSSGKIDAPSLQKLGLGSATAGVDAPKPVAPPHSVATPAPNTSILTPSGSPVATTTTSASSATPAPSPSPAPKP